MSDRRVVGYPLSIATHFGLLTFFFLSICVHAVIQVIFVSSCLSNRLVLFIVLRVEGCGYPLPLVLLCGDLYVIGVVSIHANASG